MNLLDSLKENDSVAVKQEAKTWEEAIEVCMAPLLENNAVKREYVDAIIARTNELGPFYVLAPGLAMPHERPEKGVNIQSLNCYFWVCCGLTCTIFWLVSAFCSWICIKVWN